MALKGSQVSLRGRKHFDGRLPMGVRDFVYRDLESSEHSRVEWGRWPLWEVGLEPLLCIQIPLTYH